MPFVEPVESRQYFAAVTADPSFGGGHAVVLPRGLNDRVLATHGGIYVEGFDVPRDAYYVYKLDDAGRLDTAWGEGGSLRPLITRDVRTHDSADPPDLAYDRFTAA